MHFRPRRLSTGLLLGATFLAGVAAVPASRLLAPHLGIARAFAQDDTDANRADTYRWLTLFGDVFERVRSEYVEPVPDKKLVENALDGMLAGLDPHSAYMDASQFRDMQVQTQGKFGGLGIEVTDDQGLIRVISPIDDTPASRAGIKAGDIITALDGKTVEGLPLSKAVDEMRGPPNSKITLTIKRQGIDKPVLVTLERQIIHIQVVKDRMEPHDIGYVRLSQFTEGANSGIQDAIAKLKKEGGGKLRGVVLDLRDNPGGLLDQSIEVASLFLDGEPVSSTIGRVPESIQYFTAPHRAVETLPLVVLVNGGSASAAEIVASALQDTGRAVVIGTSSYGKGTVQNVQRMPNDGELTITWARLVTPGGYILHHHGVVPTVCTADLPDDASGIAVALSRSTGSLAAAFDKPRAKLDDAAWTELRALCPGAHEDHQVEVETAEKLLGNRALYARVLIHAPAAGGVPVATAGVMR